MLLLLTSQASQVLESLLSYLMKPPHELTVAFIPTAANPYNHAPWIDMDKKKLTELGFNVYDLDLEDKSQKQIQKALEQADIIFVAGGNTFYLLEQVQKSGFASVVKELIANGVVYIGSSAGSVLAGPNIESVTAFDDIGMAHLTSFEGLHFIDFVVLPHYKNPTFGKSHEHVMQEFKDDYQFIPITDQQAIVVTDQGPKIVAL